MLIHSRKQLKIHDAVIPFSSLPFPFSFLFVITRRELFWHQDLSNQLHHIGDRATYRTVAKMKATMFPEYTWLTSHLYLYYIIFHINKGNTPPSLSFPPLLCLPPPCLSLSIKSLPDCQRFWHVTLIPPLGR